MLGTPPVHHWLHVPYDKHPELVYPVSLVAACSRETSTVFCAKSLPTEIDGIPTNYACCLGYLDVSAPYRKVGFGLLVRSETGWDLPGALRVARQRQDYGARSHGDQRS